MNKSYRISAIAAAAMMIASPALAGTYAGGNGNGYPTSQPGQGHPDYTGREPAPTSPPSGGGVTGGGGGETGGLDGGGISGGGPTGL